jgi:hypothetical protein
MWGNIWGTEGKDRKELLGESNRLRWIEWWLAETIYWCILLMKNVV